MSAYSDLQAYVDFLDAFEGNGSNRSTKGGSGFVRASGDSSDAPRGYNPPTKPRDRQGDSSKPLEQLLADEEDVNMLSPLLQCVL